MAQQKVKFLVFDAESVADGQLVANIRYPGEKLTPVEAITRYRAELMAQHDSDFIPYTFQVPISIAIAKINSQFELMDLVTLDDPNYRPHIITEHFWRGWSTYGKPTLVSFNGRSFDIPLLELAAFRYGISAADWFGFQAKTYEQYRNRYNQHAHLDLQELLTNFGASRMNGGLNLVAHLIGKPGKMGIAGHMVQDLYHENRIDEINDYCRCDVLDTYFVFLRSAVVLGQITLQQERDLVLKTRQWLEHHCEEKPAYSEYLRNWKDWENPWDAVAEKASAPTS